MTNPPHSVGSSRSRRRSPGVTIPAAGPAFSRRAALSALAAGALATACSPTTTPSPPPSGAGDPTTPTAPTATPTSGGRRTLHFWTGFTGGDGPTMAALVRQFTTEHPDIEVRFSATPWAQFYDRLDEAVLAGRGPQVAAVQVEQVASLAARQLVRPLDAAVTQLGYTDTAFLAGPWAAGEYRSQRFAIPLDVHPIGLFVNTGAAARVGLDVSRLPTTGEEYLAALDACKRGGLDGHWVSASVYPGSVSVRSLTWQFGGSTLSPDGTEIGWAGEAGLKALTWYRDLVAHAYSPNPSTAAPNADLAAFLAGRTVFRWDGGWQIRPFGERAGLQWVAAPLPNVGGTAAAWAGSHQLVRPGQGADDAGTAEAVTQFIGWLVQHGLQWAEGGQIPALNSLRDSADFRARTELAELASGLNQVRFDPAVPGIGDVNAEWDKAIQRVVLGRRDPKSALDEAVVAATSVLEVNRKRYG